MSVAKIAAILSRGRWVDDLGPLCARSSAGTMVALSKDDTLKP